MLSPEDLNFVFPLSRYNQPINELKSNFISVEVGAGYEFQKVIDDNINCRIMLNYQNFIGSIYSGSNWNLNGFSTNIGLNYKFHNYKNRASEPKEYLIINDSIRIQDTTFINRDITKDEFIELSKNPNNNYKIIKIDTIKTTKQNEDYTLNIFNIKEIGAYINYNIIEDDEVVLEGQLIIPNLDVKYKINDKLFEIYNYKVEKELIDYKVHTLKCENLNNNLLSFGNENIIKDTIFTYSPPILSFNYDIYSDNELKQNFIIIKSSDKSTEKSNELSNDVYYLDTLYLSNSKSNVDYKLNFTKFVFKKEKSKNINYFFEKTNANNSNKVKTNIDISKLDLEYKLVVIDKMNNRDESIYGALDFKFNNEKNKKSNQIELYSLDLNCFENSVKNKIFSNLEDLENKLNLENLKYNNLNQKSLYFKLKR